MGNYLKMADRRQIEALLELGWSYRRIERETGIYHETVARYDPRRQSNTAKVPTGSTGSKAARAPTGSGSSCEPYRALIEDALRKGLSAQRIWQDLQAECNFNGGYCSVKRFIRKIKSSRREMVAVLEHPPGEEAQIDFFQGVPTLDPSNGRWRRPWIFRMILACSGHSYEEPLWQQDKVSFVRAHEHAFTEFGGVPQVVRLDNLKSGVARACLYDPDISELYAAFAKHWGFTPLPCKPRTPREKGVVERGGNYLKDNALKGRQFNSLEDCRRFLQHWNRTIARLRIHGTTRKQVYAHFLEVEKPTLKPLSEKPFSLFEIGTRVVHLDGYIEVGRAFYAVPNRLLGEEVRVYWDDRLVRIYHKGESVSVYSRGTAGTFNARDEPNFAQKPARQQVYQDRLLVKAERIGEKALSWAKGAIEERGVRAYRLLQGMLSLTRKYSKEQVDWACGIALERRVFRYKPLQRLVDRAASQPPVQLPLIQSHEIIRDLNEYAKEVRE
jgi:transposase